MSTGWNSPSTKRIAWLIINLLGNEYWLELTGMYERSHGHYKPTGK